MSNIIDLVSSSPEASPPPASRKSPNAYAKGKSSIAKLTAQLSPTNQIPLPKLSSLKTRFPTSESLYKHLDTLPKSTLIEMLLAEEGIILEDNYKNASSRSNKEIIELGEKTDEEIDEGSTFPSKFPSKDPHHCVYCHQTYTPATDDWDCVVKHFGKLEWVKGYEYDKKEWSCCGKEVEGYADYEEDFMQPPHLVDEWAQYCWAGKHNSRELKEGDADAEEGSWWEGWGDSKRTCADLRCHSKPDGGHPGKKTRI